MSSRLPSRCVSFTRSSMTACDYVSSLHLVASSRSASHMRYKGMFKSTRANSCSWLTRSRCTRTDWSRFGDFGYVIATSISLPLVAENHLYASGTWMRWRLEMHGPLSTRNISIYVELPFSLQPPISTRESLSTQHICPISSVGTRCASHQSLPLGLISATSQLAPAPPLLPGP